MPIFYNKPFSKTELLRRVGDISQLASATPFELVDGPERGVRGVTLRNAAGLELDVLAERGLAITRLAYRGVPLPFLTAAGPIHPAYFEPAGLGWLRTWPAGFLTPCGLTNVGSPNADNGEELGQHGRIAQIPARSLAWGGKWREDDSNYTVYVEGTMRETRMFGENLRLTRSIWTTLDEPRLWIKDIVENLGFSEAPLMFLQHINLGFPLVDETTRLELPPIQTTPRDDDALPGLADCCRFQAPTPGYREQVFYHTPIDNGLVEVRLVNPAFNNGQGLGVALRYDTADYPILVEWKMMGEGAYVVGLEPANCHVSGRSAERRAGALQTLAPQESRTFTLEIKFF